MLCQTCERDIKRAFMYFDNRYVTQAKFYFAYGHRSDRQRFFQSCKDGCYICVSVYAVLMQKYRSLKPSHNLPLVESSQLEIAEDLIHANDFALMNGKLSIKSYWGPEWCHSTSTKFSSGHLDGGYWEKFYFTPFMETVDGIRGPLSPGKTSNTGDEGAWSVIQAWMSQCLLDHPECRIPQDQDRALPMRLIDLGPDDGHIPKVVDSNISHAEPFVTLSHCWGGELAVKLTSSNLQAYQERLPLDDMPQTFKDAFAVTKRLGSRYLWIDALCIVQDDMNEWREQSKSMADFYSNSMCTIAAHGNQNSSEGLFRDRLNVNAAPARLRIKYPEQYAGEYAVYNESSVYDYVDGPLFKRAWVFQERVFAKRMISFGKNCLFWECKASEVGPKSESCPGGMNRYGFCYMKDNLPSIFRSCMELDKTGIGLVAFGPDRGHMRYWWSRAVRYYCSFNLTHETDRLVAVSAVAKECAKFFESEYLAGLWKKWLMYDLCWVVSVPGKQSGVYVAPSWSWACRRQALQIEDWADCSPSGETWNTYQALATLVDYEMTPAGTDVTGQLVSAWLCISGCPLSVKIRDIKYMAKLDVSAHYTIDSPYPSEEDPLGFVWDVPGELWDLDLTLQLLPLIGLSRSNVEFHLIKGIVLRPAKEHEEGFFQRVGMFQFLGGRKKLSVFIKRIIRQQIWSQAEILNYSSARPDDDIWTTNERPQPLILV